MTTGAPRSAISIDALSAHHWPAVARIYAEGIASGDSTFETEVPEWEGLGFRPPRGASIRRDSG